MDSPMKQAAKLVQAKKGGSRMIALFLCLALLVTAGTVTAFVMHGHTQTHTRRVLECSYEVHAHTEDCYPGGDTALEPVCGLAEFVVHVHNDDCYDEAGALVCTLDEVEVHEHSDDCWAAPLTCTVAESDPHTHDASCYAPAEGTEPGCEQEEQEAVAGHAHTDECYIAGEAVLACGQDEAPAHHHDDGCYTTTESRDLTCTQEEGEDHQHGDGCYAVSTSTELTCTQAETEGHSHSEACWQTPAVLNCGMAEGEGAVAGHAHTNDCYAEADLALACGKEEGEGHAHAAECYGEEALVCGKAEITLHTHSEDEGCFAEMSEDEKNAGAEHGALTCDKLQVEEHTHGEDCFKTEELTPEEIAAQDAAAQKPGVEDLSLVYSDENIVVTVDYDTAALLPADAVVKLVSADTPAPVLDVTQQVAPVEAEPDAQPAEDAPEQDAEPAEEGGDETALPQTPADDAAEPETAAPVEAAPETPAEPEAAAPAEDLTGLVRAGFMTYDREWLPAATVTYTVQYLLDGQPAGEPAVYYYTPGGELPTFAPAIETFTQTVETDEFIVTARYTALAELGDAGLYAAAIEDEEQVEAYTAQYREAVNSSRAQMHALLDIGFMLDGEEIQPAAPVEITVQLLGEDGLPAGAPLAVVHFGENTEVIPAKSDEAGAAAFKMNSFSPVGIGQTPESDDEGRALLDEQNGTFEWIDPNGLYHVKFEVTGVIAPKAEEPAEGEDAEDAEDAEAPDEEAAAGAPEAEGEEDAEPAEGEADAAGIPLATAGLLEFKVEQVGEDDEEYAEYLNTATEEVGAVKEFLLMEYTLTYGGVEMDLADCEVMVTVTPTMQMQQEVAAYSRDNPVDNGDDDGDGIVDAADGESSLPAPDNHAPMFFSVLAPNDENEIVVQQTLILDGENAVAGATLPLAPLLDAPADAEEEADAANLAGQLQTDADILQTAAGRLQTTVGQFQTTAGRFQAAVGRFRAAAEEAAKEIVLSNQQLGYSANGNRAAYTVAAEHNPEFTVQYYAYLDLLTDPYKAYDNQKPSTARTDEASLDTRGYPLPLIDTSAKANNGTPKLPVNGQGVSNAPKTALRKIYLKSNGEVALHQHILVRVYTEGEFNLFSKPSVKYVQKLITNDHYELKEIWVLKDGKKPDSREPSDWDKVEVSAANLVNVYFTSLDPKTLSNAQGRTFVQIKEGTVLRFVYDATPAPQDISANFFDYDITNGETKTGQGTYDWDAYSGSSNHKGGDKTTSNVTAYVTNTSSKYGSTSDWKTDRTAILAGAQGINHPNNYSSFDAALPRLGFGNANTGAGLDHERWSDNLLNKYNGTQNYHPTVKGSYQGCTFGLATGIDANGHIIYDSGVAVPNLFGEGEAIGRIDHPDYTLQFDRVGDTYTLAFVKDSAGNPISSASGLKSFNMPKPNPNGTKVHTHIWTNNFWPMDTATGQKDPLTGTWDNTGWRYGITPRRDAAQRVWSYPVSDDGIKHNNMFGMSFFVDFQLTKDYVGPLDYCFFGDDDLWIFLKGMDDKATCQGGKLICDLGGVHSSVGEYVNLWDYIPMGSEGSYRLYFFYTERGLSGSTCWMHFTLPSVSSATTEVSNPIGSLRVDKTLMKSINNGTPEHVDNGEEFKFAISFKLPSNINKQPEEFYIRYDKYEKGANGKDELLESDMLLWSGGEFTLKDNQYMIIEGLPLDTVYTVTEQLNSKDGNALEDGTIGQSGYNYTATVKVNGASQGTTNVATGTITADQSKVEFTNTYTVFRMPKTGGVPGIVYMGSGAMLILLAAAACIQRKRRKKAEETPAK